MFDEKHSQFSWYWWYSNQWSQNSSKHWCVETQKGTNQYKKNSTTIYIGVQSYYFLFTVYGFLRIIGKHAKPFSQSKALPGLTRSFLTAHEYIWVDLPQRRHDQPKGMYSTTTYKNQEDRKTLSWSIACNTIIHNYGSNETVVSDQRINHQKSQV